MISLIIAKTFTPEQRAELDRRIQIRKEALSQGDPHRGYLCPLNVDGKCGIYNVRPSNCRSFHSFDADACREIFREGKIETLRPMDRERTQADAVIFESASVAYTALKMDTRGLELISALEAALPAGDGVVERFTTGVDIFAGVPSMETRTPSSTPT